jgi:hypothetical protein
MPKIPSFMEPEVLKVPAFTKCHFTEISNLPAFWHLRCIFQPCWLHKILSSLIMILVTGQKPVRSDQFRYLYFCFIFLSLSFMQKLSKRLVNYFTSKAADCTFGLWIAICKVFFMSFWILIHILPFIINVFSTFLCTTISNHPRIIVDD